MNREKQIEELTNELVFRTTMVHAMPLLIIL